MKPVVLVTRKLPERVEERLRRDYTPILNPDDALYSPDEIIERAPLSEERRAMIFANRIYRHFSEALAGSHEYAAIEKVCEAHESGRYDLVILDTPPAQNVESFLDAPHRVLEFLENETLHWLLRTTPEARGLSERLLQLGGGFLWRTLGSLAGGNPSAISPSSSSPFVASWTAFVSGRAGSARSSRRRRSPSCSSRRRRSPNGGR